MSALTDFFTSLANKIRSKLGTSTTYTPTQAVSAIDDVYSKGVSDTKVGTAAAGDVLTGKTFTNSTTVGASGSMPDNTAVGKKYVQNGASDTSKPAFRWNPNHYEIAPMSGKWAFDWDNCCCVYGDDKSATPSTSSQTISPDTGHVLHSVTVSAISPQRNNGTSATGSGIDSTGPYVYIPYGWWKEYSGKAGSSYAYMTAAQAVAACPKETLSVSPSTSSQTKTPSSGKLYSSVTVSAISPQRSANTAATTTGTMSWNGDSTYGYVYFPYGWWPQEDSTYGNYCRMTKAQAQAAHVHTETATPTGANRYSSAYDLGRLHSYRYVNTLVCYNLGHDNGADGAYNANKFYGKQEWDGTATYHDFTWTGLKANGKRYFFVCMMQQTGGTYSGQGSGAKVSITSGGTIDGETGFEQVSCQSANTSGLGGMVMRSYGAFTKNSTTSVTIRMNLATSLTGYWCMYLWGNY